MLEWQMRRFLIMRSGAFHTERSFYVFRPLDAGSLDKLHPFV